MHGAAVFLTVAEYLRNTQFLCGTKVVCAEGDCGACTVLIGRIEGDQLRYRPVDCCIVFVHQVDSCHVITVEGLGENGTLHPVQQAMVDCHGSQCGYCTPGIVMAIAGWAEAGAPSNRARIALTGNLCRCTGYLPILDAATKIALQGEGLRRKDDSELSSELHRLTTDALEIETPQVRFRAPTSISGATKFKEENPQSVICGGATELGVWRNKRDNRPAAILSLGRIPGLAAITSQDERLEIGACTTWAQFEEIVDFTFPTYRRIVERFGSPQIRNIATMVGNVANGSPIADSLGLLSVMDAQLGIISSRGRRTRSINGFYTGYKRKDLAPGELIERVMLPLPDANDRLHFVKVSRRTDLDIATFGSAIRIREEAGGITHAAIALTGVAATVVRLHKTESFLVGRIFNELSFREAGRIARSEIQPITDVRGSKDFRLQLAENVFLKFYFETTESQEALT